MIKSLALIVALFLTSSYSLASGGRVTCSNPEGTIYAEGRLLVWDVVLTEYEYEDGEPTFTRVEYDARLDLNLDFTDSIQLDRKETRTCYDSGSGAFSITTISADVLTIQKSDGTEFDEKTMHLSSDKKSIQVHVICKRNINGRAPCQN